MCWIDQYYEMKGTNKDIWALHILYILYQLSLSYDFSCKKLFVEIIPQTVVRKTFCT